MNNNQMPNGLDMAQLISTAQKLAQNIAQNDDGKMKNMGMENMLEHITETVFSTMEKSGKQIDPASKNQLKSLSKAMLGNFDLESLGQDQVQTQMPNSKIHLGDSGDASGYAKGDASDLNKDLKIPTKNTNVEVLDSDSDADELQPRVRSIHYDLDVTLEDLYVGKTKKLAVNRKRLVKGTTKLKEEKVKLEIPIIPGSKDGQEIRFNYQGNEKPGYDTGDIVITLSASEHSTFQRSGNHLHIVKNISLYESYAAAKGDINVVIEHLNGSYMVLEPDGKPLHENDGGRKIKGAGMPVLKKQKDTKQEYGDLYIRFNLILPEPFEDETALKILEKMFPILESNKDSTVFKDPKTRQVLKKGFDSSNANIKKVYMSEVTPEDLEQLEYESDNEEEEDEDEESESEESGSD